MEEVVVVPGCPEDDLDVPRPAGTWMTLIPPKTAIPGNGVSFPVSNLVDRRFARPSVCSIRSAANDAESGSRLGLLSKLARANKRHAVVERPDRSCSGW